jgi:undecaprenyl diphosphate synthase
MAPTTGLQNVSTRAGGAKSGQPLHVAIIMDGNGRWAKRRNLPRVLGHRAGVNALKRTVEGAAGLGVGVMTVFGFSTENWSRPPQEVSELMGLLKAYLESDLERLAREGVRVRIIGRRTGLAPDILDVIERAERRTARTTPSCCRWRSTMAAGPTSPTPPAPSPRRSSAARPGPPTWTKPLFEQACRRPGRRRRT